MARRADHPRLRSFHKYIDLAVWPGALICAAYTFLGLGMVLQPSRFSATPAYGNLTQVLDIRLWGAMYLAVAALFGVYTVLVTGRLFGIVVHIPGAIVTGTWWLAFIIRWRTDDSTTVVNVVSWMVFILIIMRSASLIPVASRPKSGAT
jgi:hypothetical protein